MSVQLLLGDCKERLKDLTDSSVDSVVTDPPYELGFMGKAWDNSGIAYDVNMWREVLRVLKPGGHLLAFGGTRTYHRMAVAIEDAGFEIRDQMQWLYGSGFPKSLDVAKALDKSAGTWRDRATSTTSDNAAMSGPNYGRTDKGNPVTGDAVRWNGWGTALKPANEPICVARKPLSESTVAKNVLTHGTGAINIDGTRIKGGGSTVRDNRAPSHFAGPDAGAGDVDVTGSTKGRWPANVVLSHSDGCQLVGTKKVKTNMATNGDGKDGQVFNYGNERGSEPRDHAAPDGTETVEKWECVEGCAVKMLDEQSVSGGMHGAGKERDGSSAKVASSYEATSFELPMNRNMRRLGDVGGASRFFYCAKASRSERNAGCEDLPFTWTPGGEPSTKRDGEPAPINAPDGSTTSTRGTTTPNKGNVHSTVKPVKLMEYLCRLVTPPNGTILDPFLGSGTTGVAAIHEGFNFIGIEREEEYMKIAEARIAHAEKEKNAVPPSLLDVSVDAPVATPES